MITLTYTTTTVTLPADMQWLDEFEWRPVVQSTEPTIAGGMIVQSATRTKGREITLKSGENFAVLTRAQLDTLNSWADVPGRIMTLNIRGAARAVIFAHHTPPAITAEMVMYHAAPAAGDLYVVTLKFIEV